MPNELIMATVKIFDLSKKRQQKFQRQQELDAMSDAVANEKPRGHRPKSYCQLLLENPQCMNTGLLDLALDELIGHKLKMQWEFLKSIDDSRMKED